MASKDDDGMVISEDESEISLEDSSQVVRVKKSTVHEEFVKEEVSRRRKAGEAETLETQSSCNHCSKKYWGKNPTTLKTHLKSSHRKIFEEVEKKDALARDEQKIKAKRVISKSSSGRKTAGDSLFVQRRNVPKVSLPKDEQKEMDRRLAFWVWRSTLPINFIEEPSFKTFLQGLNIQVNWQMFFIQGKDFLCI